MASAERQPLQMRDSQTHNRRTPGVNFGRFLAAREARLLGGVAPGSPAGGERERKTEARVAKSAVRGLSMGEENERSIIPVPSNISRFSRGTDRRFLSPWIFFSQLEVVIVSIGQAPKNSQSN
jgi:hypothetical protein